MSFLAKEQCLTWGGVVTKIAEILCSALGTLVFTWIQLQIQGRSDHFTGFNWYFRERAVSMTRVH